MSTMLPAVAPTLGPALIAHLDEQLASTERLLALVLRQASAIRDRDVDTVLASLTEIQTEMEHRAGLERHRGELLARAAGALGVQAHAVTLDAICSLLTAPEAHEARARSGQLRGLLAEVTRQHQANRVLMRQELAFLDHLTRMLGGEESAGAYAPPGGQRPAGAQPVSSPRRVLDLQA